jgi:hypothetical protein
MTYSEVTGLHSFPPFIRINLSEGEGEISNFHEALIVIKGVRYILSRAYQLNSEMREIGKHDCPGYVGSDPEWCEWIALKLVWNHSGVLHDDKEKDHLPKSFLGFTP